MVNLAESPSDEDSDSEWAGDNDGDDDDENRPEERLALLNGANNKAHRAAASAKSRARTPVSSGGAPSGVKKEAGVEVKQEVAPVVRAPGRLCPEPGCNRRFLGIGALVQHVDLHNGVKRFVCLEPMCGKAYSLEHSYQAHYKAVHAGTHADFEFACPAADCPLRLKKRRQRAAHVREWHPTYEFAHICNAAGR
jgi:hypothetical protein